MAAKRQNDAFEVSLRLGKLAMLESVAAVPVTAFQGAATASPEPAPSATQAASADAKPTIEHPSPSLQIDPEVGIVVIQYRSSSGKIELSIPSQQQLDAYAANPAAAADLDGANTLA